MRSHFNIRLASVTVCASIFLSAFIIVSCHKKDGDATMDSTSTATDTLAMETPAKGADTTSMPADTTAKMNDAPNAGEKYGDDDTSIKKALRTIREANVKNAGEGNMIVLGTPKDEDRKCASVKFKSGQNGKVCASKATIDRIKAECDGTHDCSVTDAP